MRQVFVRALGTLAAIVGLSGGVLAAATSAGAVEPGIRRPTLTVVCDQPHHGKYFTAVRYVQRGSWAAGGEVVVSITRGDSVLPRAVMKTTTGSDGSFHLHRTLNSKDLRPWVVGARYNWTTTIFGKTWATARRGTVTVTGSC